MSPVEELSIIPLPLWILIAVLLFSQSTWLFLDARKRKAFPWLWGLWGLIQVPTPLIVYLFAVRKIHRPIYQKFKK